MSWNHKDLVTLYNYTKEEIWQILKTAEVIKLQWKSGDRRSYLPGKTLGMIFEKPSTRTRISFEVGMYQLGGQALYLSKNDLQLGRGETVADTARVLSHYVDGIMARTFAHKTIEDLAQYGTVPVINGLSDLSHPCQILADLMTIYEKKRKLEGLKLAYIGDGNNVAHSLLFGTTKVGMNIAIANPEGYDVDPDVLQKAQEIALTSGSEVSTTHDPQEAAQNADILYTDVWASMGQEEEREKRLQDFQNFALNAEKLRLAKADSIVMHCLPAHRGEEITNEVIDGPHSVVFDQAENRLHAQKGIMALLMH